MAAHHGLSRREAIRRAALLAGASALPFGYLAASEQPVAAWVAAVPPAAAGPGYGKDPALLHPAPAPWPRTLSHSQRHLVSVLADIVLPADAEAPAASSVGVTDVIDEWVSAPYPEQQRHRALILSGLAWCDREALRRHGADFARIASAQQLAIVDTIADSERLSDPALVEPARFFDQFRQLTVGAYYTSPEGLRELGYEGNVPIAGDYPGPSDEAMAHLNEQLARLGLS